MLEIRHKAVADGQPTQDAYNEYYQESEILMRDSFYMWLIEQLNPERGSLLLDISTGQGRLVQLAVEKELRAIGLDFALEGMLWGASRSPESMWVVGDGEQIPFADNSFDYITHIGSLEHYANFYAGASEIARLLSPTGRACILLPNAFGLLGNIKRVYQTGEIFDDGQPLQRYATLATWQQVLAAGGLAVERVVPWGEFNYPRTRADLLWTLKRPQKFVRSLILPFIPKPLANHFVFICRRAEEPAVGESAAGESAVGQSAAVEHYPMLPAPSELA